MSFQIDWIAPNGDRLHVHDDGSVGYAYWFDGREKIVADVWLYNVSSAPQDKPWKNKNQNPPYLNPLDYIYNELEFHPQKVDIESEWVTLKDVFGAKIYLRGEEIAIIYPGDKPGRSRLVKKDGPLARLWK